jgi:hypothetical protein
MRLFFVLLGLLLVAEARPAPTTDVAVAARSWWNPFGSEDKKKKEEPAITDADLKNPKLADYYAKSSTTVYNPGKNPVKAYRCPMPTLKQCKFTVKNPPHLKPKKSSKVICKYKDSDGKYVLFTPPSLFRSVQLFSVY